MSSGDSSETASLDPKGGATPSAANSRGDGNAVFPIHDVKQLMPRPSTQQKRSTHSDKTPDKLSFPLEHIKNNRKSALCKRSEPACDDIYAL
jgi:hypothetical protein